MKRPNIQRSEPLLKLKLFKKFILVFLITLIVFVSFFEIARYTLYKSQLRQEAVSVSDQVNAFKRWITSDGTFVSYYWVDKKNTDMQDFVSPAELKEKSGRITMKYYSKSFSVATIELSKVYSSVSKGATFRISSENYRNPANKSDQFEIYSMKAFRKDKKLPYTEKLGASLYEYSQPLIAEKSCLQCHGDPEDAPKDVIDKFGSQKAFGYKEGDVIGVLTVSVPLKNKNLFAIMKSYPIVAGGSLIFILTIAFNLVWFRHSIIKPIDSIRNVIANVGKGSYQDRISLKTKDELTDVANTFNVTMDHIVESIQTEEDRKQAQEHMVGFLNLMSTAAEGNLTHKAEVTPDIFGSLADAFNVMVDGLSDLITRVKNSIEDMNRERLKILDVLKEMEHDTETQMSEVKKATSAVDNAATSATLITNKTQTAQKVSRSALESIDRGNKTVLESLDGIQLIRVTIQSINKRMKYLSEKLLEIGTISQLITEISNRTDLLAINASIEAARAGEQGKGFVVIAEEIRGLAERSSKSTKQIGEIINAIQVESNEVTKYLEQETNYVEAETKMASDTAAVFKEVENVIKNINSIVSEIDTSAEGQKTITAKVVESMNAIQNVSQQLLKMVRDFSEIAGALSNTSVDLLSFTTKFKLPEK